MNKIEEFRDKQIEDYIAGALLLPFSIISQELDNIGYTNLSTHKRYKFVQKLSKEYSVSEVLVLRRINEVYKLRKAGYTG